jgi:NAD(P)-dependent dehydrogenase (short-subunit alcohol dehydrogenase family)
MRWQIAVIPVDVADAAQIEAAAEKVEATLGPIDIWVNNAMTSVFARFGDMTPEEFRRVTEVTYLGVVYGTMAALKRMRSRNRGCVVPGTPVHRLRAIAARLRRSGERSGVYPSRRRTEQRDIDQEAPCRD